MRNKRNRTAAAVGVWLLFAAISAAMLSLGGCAAKVPSSPTVPGRPATAYENVLAWNAAIANANLAVTQGIINANTAAALDDAQTKAMLDQTFDLARANRQLTLILQSGPDGVRSGRQTVNSLLMQIQASGGQLVTLGTLHIKNPQSQATVKASIDAILTFAQNIFTALAAL